MIDRWDLRTWSLIAAATALAVYAPSLLNGFAYDDISIIVENAGLHSWSSLPGALTEPYWPGPDGADLGLWRPTTTLALGVTWLLFGGAAVGFHLLNVMLHAAVAALVVRVAGTLVTRPAAGLAGIVFAVHPVHVEAVANAVGLAELLAAALVLSALLLATSRRWSGHRGTIAVCVLFGLAIGAKEGAIVLPGLIVLLDAARARVHVREFPALLRRRAHLLVGLVAVAAFMLWSRAQILTGVASTSPPLGAHGLADIPRIWTLGEVWHHVLRLVTVPTWLSPNYSPEVIPVLTGWTSRGTLGVLGVLVALLAAWIAARFVASDAGIEADSDFPVGLAVGVAWFAIALGPTSNILFLSGELLAERTLYLPSVGSSLVMACAAVWLIRFDPPPRIVRLSGVVVASLLLIVWGTRTVTYIPAWRSQDSIFQYMIDVVPESGRSQWVMGDIRLGRGDVEGAMIHYRAAFSALGASYVFLTESGRHLLVEGEHDRAIPFLERAFEARPDEFTAPQIRAVAASQLGDWGGTEEWARITLERAPRDVTAWHLLSLSLEAGERWAEAAAARSEVARLDPTPWQPWSSLAELWLKAGDTLSARAAADSALLRAPPVEVRARLDSLARLPSNHE